MNEMKFKRVLLKLSGETLAGDTGSGIQADRLESVAREVAEAYAKDVQIAVVIGAGNIWRGAGKAIDRVTADNMGMLATIMNSLALRDALEARGVPARVMSAIDVSKVAELYVRDNALEHLRQKRVVILAGGTGNPFFTTDTTAALRAAELDAEVILKATQVDGVYDDDPKKNRSAKKYARLTFDEAIQKQLRVMDITAFSLCRENNVPIVVFDFYCAGNLLKALSGENIGTLVTRGG
jgi:uridylate kinase